MLIFIILGARLRQDKDTDSRQAPKLIERQDYSTRPAGPLSIPFRYDKLRRTGQALNLRRSQSLPRPQQKPGLSLFTKNPHPHLVLQVFCGPRAFRRPSIGPYRSMDTMDL